MSRSKSSRRWLKRQHADLYVRQAKKQDLPSRAVFKLQELDAKERLFWPGMTVVDLGASPGGWSLYAANRVGDAGRVIAMDLLPMNVPVGVAFIQGDFREQAALEQVLAIIGDTRINLIMSDMTPNMSGMRSVDQPRTLYLAELAFDFARKVLAPGGDFLVKLFQGEGFVPFSQGLRTSFRRIVICKPKASRADSREMYLLARHFIV